VSRDGSGNYSLPAGNPVVTNTIISSGGWANPTLNDIAAALTQSLSKDGQTVPTANLPMGNFRHTAVANAVNRNEYATAAQMQDGGLTALSSVAGTDTITATTAPAIGAYAAGQCFDFIAAGANTTTAVTLNINGLGAKNITKLGAALINIGDFQVGMSVRVRYDGTQFQVISPLLSSFSGKNRLINGDFRISQYNAASAVTPATTAANVYVIDRWAHFSNQASKLTYQQVTAPSGFVGVAFAEKISVASAFAAGAGDYFHFRQPVEGLNVQDLQWGTPSAKPVTVQIQASASLTGTYSVFFSNYAGSRSYIATINIAVANTPQFFSITVPGDTGGGWAAIGTTGFLYFGTDLGSGSSFNATAGAWGGGYTTRTSGSVSLVANAGASITVSGTGFEVGTVANPFEQRTYSQELSLCNRYYRIATYGLTISTSSGSQYYANIYLQEPMRVAPTGALVASNYLVNFAGSPSYSPVGPNWVTVARTANATGLGGFFESCSLSAEL
jgi:hypothetical protein